MTLLDRCPRLTKHILVVTYVFSKYIEMIPVSSQTAAECAQALVDRIVSHWGTPLMIHTDQGTAFESRRLFKSLSAILQVKKSRTSARNPKGNIQVERVNRTIIKMIKAYLNDQQDNWDQHLQCLASAYNSTIHQATGLTPNMILLGREIRSQPVCSSRR